MKVVVVGVTHLSQFQCKALPQNSRLVIFKFSKSDLEMCSPRMFILTSAIFIISEGVLFAISYTHQNTKLKSQNYHQSPTDSLAYQTDTIRATILIALQKINFQVKPWMHQGKCLSQKLLSSARKQPLGFETQHLTFKGSIQVCHCQVQADPG